MQAEDRLIHFSTELIHRPAPHKVPELQKLYFELTQTKAAYDSSDFSQPPQFRFYSRKGKTQSILLLLPDRLLLIEEWADIPLSSFIEKVRIVAEKAFAILGMAPFHVQTATLRSTFALTHFDDARVFLMDHACKQEGVIGPHFGRPIGVGGLQFVLPETPDHPGDLHVTIQSFPPSRNEVYVEVKAIFKKQQIGPDALEQTADHIRVPRGFITNHVAPYLNQFDLPRQEESGEAF